jgi:(S)-2-hydroxyglutarate dehydrogenase
MKVINTDFLIIGAGVVGISIAREIKNRNPRVRVTILEKEPYVGLHSSVRNSSVLHSGIYYPSNSLKAQVCSQGAAEMKDYHREHGIPLNECGKILITTNKHDAPQLDTLLQRAKESNILVEELNDVDLKKMEPDIQSFNGKGLYVPSTAVGDSKKVMKVLKEEVIRMGVSIKFNSEIVEIFPGNKQVNLADGKIYSYGHAINAAGLHADKIAHQFGVGQRYTLLPFKGIYWKLAPDSGINLKHLVYPVPDLRVPFLGVHTTTSVDGTVYLGPTAVPAFGRENYHGMEGVNMREFFNIASNLTKQFIKNKDGFRRLSWQEGSRYVKPRFTSAAKKILPGLKMKHLLPSAKVGIRAQMLNIETGKMVTDFLVESGENSTHIINAISPAWTSAFPFARYIYDNHITKKGEKI